MLDIVRKEIKYAISFIDESIIANRLRLVMDCDPHNGTQGYLVRSLYFDTLQNQDYFEKMDGLENRKKIRLRIYDPKDQSAKL